MFNPSPCHFIKGFRPPLSYANSKVAPFELHRHTSEAAPKPVSNLLTTGSCKNRFSTAAIKESLQGTL